MIGLSVYILADTLFIANGVGEAGLTALNLALPVFTFILGIGLLVGIGGATWYTILRAQGKEQSATSVFNHALILGVIISLVLIGIGLIGSDWISKVLGADPLVIDMTSIYIKVILLFAPFFIFNNMLVAFIRNDNNPKLAMAGMFVGSFANILLDYIFIFTFDMGMFGAALATGVTPLVSLGLLSFHFKTVQNTLSLQKIKWEIFIFWKMCTLGISAFITEISSGVVLLVFNIIILRIAGNTGVAAYSIIANVAFVVLAIFTGMAQGIQPIVSHLFGLGKFREMKRIFIYGVMLSVLTATILYLIVFSTSDQLIGLFNKDNSETLASIAQLGLTIYFMGFFFAGFNMIAIAYLSAIEQAGIAFRLSIIRAFVLIVPIILVLAYLFEMRGVWLSFVVTEAVTSCIIIWQLIRFNQKNKKGVLLF